MAEHTILLTKPKGNDYLIEEYEATEFRLYTVGHTISLQHCNTG